MISSPWRRNMRTLPPSHPRAGEKQLCPALEVVRMPHSPPMLKKSQAPAALRRRKTRNRSLPSGNEKGPLQWALTVTEALHSPSQPQLDCFLLLGDSKVNRGWGDCRGNTLAASPSSPGGRRSFLLWLSLRSCHAARSPFPPGASSPSHCCSQ